MTTHRDATYYVVLYSPDNNPIQVIGIYKCVADAEMAAVAAREQIARLGWSITVCVEVAKGNDNRN